MFISLNTVNHLLLTAFYIHKRPCKMHETDIFVVTYIIEYILIIFEFDFGVLRHMQQYFSHICDGT